MNSLKEQENLSLSPKTTIPIVFACDDNYAQHLCVCIASILTNKKPDEQISIYVLDNGITEESKQKIISLNSISPFDIEFMPIDITRFDKCPITDSCKHISVATYFRFILPEILPNVDKILYLDCDICVTTSLYELYNTDIEEHYAAVVQDILDKESCERLNLDRYFNAGVMLINLKKWREDNIEEKLFEYCEKFHRKIVWVDQDVLNVILQDKLLFVDKKWNAQTSECANTYDFNKIAKNTPGIAHFISYKKPWSKVNNSPNKKIYFKYLRLTPWKKQLALYRFQSIAGTISYIRKSVILVRLHKCEFEIKLFRHRAIFIKRAQDKLSGEFFGIRFRHQNEPLPYWLIKIHYVSILNRLYFDIGAGCESRAANTVYMFMKAFDLIRENFNHDFTAEIHCDDYIHNNTPNKKVFSYSRKPYENNVILIPDPFFVNWVECGIPSYEKLCSELLELGKSEPVYDKVFWIGNTSTSPDRVKLVENFSGKQEFEFVGMDWVRETNRGNQHKATKYVSLQDHTKYKYLLDIQGYGWSGRVKFLLWMNRPLFLVDREDKDYYTEMLQPFVHYIPVKSDLSDLEEKYRWAEDNYEQARKIAQNALEFAKENLTFDAVIEYYANVLLKEITSDFPKIKKKK